ncbi:MAG TPA: hypothetical protein VE242_02885 [Chthoniobacterales bacterium]|nr:hypothetical protein [Chthoniobacterales bacterium]
MKKILLSALLASALIAHSAPALSDSDFRWLVKWADDAGYVYEGPREVHMLDDAGHPETDQIFLFSRASDASIACAQANAQTLRDAQMQFIGSKYLSHYLQANTNK